MKLDDKVKIGRRVIRLRTKRGLTRRQLANSIGAGYNTLQKIESGRNAPNLSTALAIARKFSVTLDWLAGHAVRKPA